MKKLIIMKLWNGTILCAKKLQLHYEEKHETSNIQLTTSALISLINKSKKSKLVT